MTWETAAKVLGRRPVTIVELDLDYCQLTYGVGACPAVLGVDSVDYCYNTKRTCAVPAAYDPAARTYRFSNRELGPITLSVPCLVSAGFTSTKIDPGRSLGTRASILVTLQDFPWADRDVDKYVENRAYNPELQGSYFGKLLTRNPYYQNRAMRVLRGYLDNDGAIDLSKFQTHYYLIDRIEGPDGKGVVRIHGIDPLRLADDIKAQIPTVSTGVLQYAITDIGTTVNLLPVGIGNLEYPANGVASIDEEVVNFSRVGDVVTLNLRGAQTTLPVDHDANATFQLAKVYESAPLSDVIYDLLTVTAQVPTSYIDKPAWDAEIGTWLSGHLLNCTITEPTGVNKLLNELSATCLVYIWYDDVARLIQLRAIRPEDPAEAVRTLTDLDSFVADSISINEDPDQRVSQVWAHFARRNPLLKLDELRNFQTTEVYIDLEAETAQEYGEKRVKRILCRFFSEANQSQAIVLAARMISRYRDNPRQFKFEVDAKDADMLVGDVITVSTKSLQNVDGSPITTTMQILKRTEKVEGHKFAYEASDTFFSGRYGFILPTGTLDYLAATEAQRLKGCFICDSITLKMPNGDPPYKII